MRHTNLFSGLTFARLISLGSTRKADVLNKRQFLPEDPFDWSTIEPSADIEYHDCYDDLRCARLLVPLDWSKHNSTEALDLDETAAIAIVKIPASVPETDPSFGGPILYIPGGPAVSGASRVREEGKTLQSLFDGDKHFDIIGFDPRGVGATTPPIRCYQDETKRWTAVDILGGLPPVGSGPVTLQYHLQTFKAFWDICEEASLNNTVFPHVATASVARDMLEIVDKVEASKPHCSNSSGSRGKHEAKLQYYGQSYGTYLGATFACMFPDRVGLMVLDSVVDADGWNRGEHIDGFDDLDNAIDVIWEYCFSIKNACPLWQQTDTSALDIKARVDGLMADLQTSPVVIGARGEVHLFALRHVSSLILPLAYFSPGTDSLREEYLEVLARVLRGDYLSWWYRDDENGDVDEDGEREDDISDDEGSSDEDEWPPQRAYSFLDAFPMIRCTDGYNLVGIRERNSSWAQGVVDELARRHPRMAAMASEWSLACYGMSDEFKPKYTFPGPFGGPAPDTSSNKTTVAPVLLLNNRFDPVTPLSAAYRLSSSLEGSSVVAHEAAGHIAIAYAGDCLKNILQSYFNEGLMPVNGTVCQPEVSALPGLPIDVSKAATEPSRNLGKRMTPVERARVMDRMHLFRGIPF